MMSIGRFYAMIGALIRDVHSGKYLVLRRSAEKDVGAGAWECVTGRVDQGEGFPEALQREVMEELGVGVQPDFILRTSHFYRGASIPENEMVGVMVACSLENPEAIQTSWEHSEAHWVTADDAVQLLPEGHWLVELIQRAETVYALMPDELLAYYHTAGI
jgi:8-oxo-dGTP pyrophosphatase MutT (NUDIX family)